MFMVYKNRDCRTFSIQFWVEIQTVKTRGTHCEIWRIKGVQQVGVFVFIGLCSPHCCYRLSTCNANTVAFPTTAEDWEELLLAPAMGVACTELVMATGTAIHNITHTLAMATTTPATGMEEAMAFLAGFPTAIRATTMAIHIRAVAWVSISRLLHNNLRDWSCAYALH